MKRSNARRAAGNWVWTNLWGSWAFISWVRMEEIQQVSVRKPLGLEIQ
jgi:hypothetical protein